MSLAPRTDGAAAGASAPVAGPCRYCRCVGDCRLQEGDECGWFTAARDVCTNPACVRQWAAYLRSLPRRQRALVEGLVRPIRERVAESERRKVEARRKKAGRGRR